MYTFNASYYEFNKNMNNTKLYLDDERFPKGKEFVIVRSYDEFVRWIYTHGMPDYISFDHDIASYDNDGHEKTGLDAAKYVVDYCIDNNVKCPDFNVHSANPVGADSINSLLTNFKNFQKEKEKKIKVLI